MLLYEEILSNFITEIDKSIEVIDVEQAGGVYRINTSRYFVYLYLPQAMRQESVRDKPIIHIDIDQIISSQTKILKRLRGLFGFGNRVYARQTVVARIDKKVTLAFLEEHHLQVAMAGKYRYGLYHRGELVSVAVFSGGRLMREERDGYRSFELIRFCNKADYLVVGGLSKLIKAFVKAFCPQDIMTYADLDWTDSSSLETIGFKVVGKIEPQCYLVEDGVRRSIASEESKDSYFVTNKGSLKLKLIL